MTIQLIYNPNCSKSIKTLEIIKNHGIEPKLLYYLEEDLSKKFLISLANKLNLKIHDIIRDFEQPYIDNNLSENNNDDLLLSYIIKFPILQQRPIAINNKVAIICRPSEKVLNILK